MVPCRQPGPLSADLLLWAWVSSGWLVPSSGPELCSQPIQPALGLSCVWPACVEALGLSCSGLRGRCGTESHVAGQSSCFGPESRSLRVRCFEPVGGAASLCSRCAPTRGFRCGHPTGVSGVGPLSALLGVGNQASGESWGCLSHVQRPGAEGGGVPEAAAAAESSLTSP